MSSWWRAWSGMAADPKWLAIGKRAGIAPGMAFSVAFHLMERAAEAEDRGSFAGYDAEAIGCFLGCETEEVEAVVAALSDKGMTAGDRFTAWERRQPKREDDSNERVRAFRARKAEAASASGAATAPTEGAEMLASEAVSDPVTQCNAPEADTEKEKKAAAAQVERGARDHAAAAAISLIGDEREKRERTGTTDEAVSLHGWICAEARSPNGWRSDLGLVRDWLQRGFSAAEIRAGVAAVLARERGQLPTSLRYFEGAISDQRRIGGQGKGAAAAKSRPAESAVIDWHKASDEQWRKPIDLWARMRRERGDDPQDWPDWSRWRPAMGPPPDKEGCLAPPALVAAALAAAGIGTATNERRRVSGGQR
ncbi:MAG TPA: hypothetical protein VNX29_02035 [Kaistia sp.]|nr:hypothetical protein [Kaistia sp.]